MSDTDRLPRAAQFIWRRGRLLEQRLFAHHWLAPDPDGVAAALAAYVTPDGGYGYALEPDGRGPVSQPLHVDLALTVLDEIGRLDQAAAEPIGAYLASISHPDGGLPAVHPSIRDYPKAPWWAIDEGGAGSLIPTAHIAGLLCRNGIQHPWLSRAVEFCWSAIDALTRTHPYEVANAVSFLDGVADRVRAAKAAARLGELALGSGMVLLDPDHPERVTLAPGYAEGEFHLPYDFAPTPDSVARPWFTDADFAKGLDFLAAEQQEDGGWHVRFARWDATAHTEWNGIATVRALTTLARYDR
ncbi:MAG TPA: hypothetical protein VG756_21010 [Pseudonocardiaceae bacterium]|jgi:hypothetical protein|nr:hypothetical protein [Pseudonocardiaceae bacterium]